MTIELPDERIAKPRSDHQHIDVENPEVAATYLRHLNELVGPVESSLTSYTGMWRCDRCKQWRMGP